jgi:hypothetical protein
MWLPFVLLLAQANDAHPLLAGSDDRAKAPPDAAQSGLRKSGAIALQEGEDNATLLNIGQEMELKLRIYTQKRPDTPLRLLVPYERNNPSQRRLYYAIHLAFFDKQGSLLGCGGWAWHAKPGDRARSALGFRLTEDEIQRVSSYRLCYYEDRRDGNAIGFPAGEDIGQLELTLYGIQPQEKLVVRRSSTSDCPRLELGEQIEVGAAVRLPTYEGHSLLHATPYHRNPRQNPVHYRYDFAVFDDADGLLGCKSYSYTLKPGARGNGSLSLHMPYAQLKRMAKYHVIYSEKVLEE